MTKFKADILQLQAQKAADRKSLKDRGLKHPKDDQHIRQKYDQLKQRAKKLMPMILRTEDKNLIKKMTSSLRCHRTGCISAPLEACTVRVLSS